MMHRDLKSPNVLLSEEGVAKIADVGMVRPQVQELVTAQPIMTPLWAAPEVITASGQQPQRPPVCLFRISCTCRNVLLSFFSNPSDDKFCLMSNWQQLQHVAEVAQPERMFHCSNFEQLVCPSNP